MKQKWRVYYGLVDIDVVKADSEEEAINICKRGYIDWSAEEVEE